MEEDRNRQVDADTDINNVSDYSATSEKYNQSSMNQEDEDDQNDVSESVKETGSLKLRALLSSKKRKYDDSDAPEKLDGASFVEEDLPTQSDTKLIKKPNWDTSNELGKNNGSLDESPKTLPFKQYFGNNNVKRGPSAFVSNGSLVRLSNYANKYKHTNNLNQSSHGNGKVPLAYDTNISLLKLAYKLKVAQEKLMSKTSHRINHSMKKSADNQQHTFHNVKFVNNVYSKSHQMPGSSRGSEIKLNSSVHRVMEMKPLVLPKFPKQAIDVLTSLKLNEGKYETKAPPCKHVPLWPVLGASRDGAIKMDTSFLNKYLNDPELSSSDQTHIKSGRQTPVRLAENLPGNGNSVKAEDITSLTMIPEPLIQEEREAIEKIAISTILQVNLPKIAKKAYDMTRLCLDASRKAVYQSGQSTGQKPKADHKVHLVPTDDNSKVSMKDATVIDVQGNLHRLSDIRNSNTHRVPDRSFAPIHSPYTVSLLKESLIRKNRAVQSKSPISNASKVHNVQEGASSDQMVLLIKDINTDSNTLELVSPGTSSDVKSQSQIPTRVLSTETLPKKGKTNIDSINGEASSNSKLSIPRKYQCLQCTYQTDNRSHLRRHESSVHSGDKMYCCYVCKKEFARSEKCRAHIIKSHPAVGYDARFIRKDKFQSRQVHSSPKKVTPVLEKCVESKSALPPNREEVSLNESALSTNSDTKEQSCLEAGETSIGEPAEVNEGQTVVPIEESISPTQQGSNSDSNGMSPSKSYQNDSSSRMYRCQICFYVGRDAWHLKRHISDVHNNKKAFKCRMCTYVTSRKHRLISHMKGHGELFCMHCDYSTTDYEKFQTHLKHCSLRQKAGSLTCKNCNQSFFNRKILADHMLRFHKLKLYCCNLCYFTSSDSEEFEEHELQHFKADCSTTCNKCKVSFDTEKQCEEHILQFHRGEEKDEILSDTHVNKTDDNCYKCTMCGYENEHMAVMKNHLEMHSRNMNRCELAKCPFTAASKKALKHHVQSEHPDIISERKSPERKLNKVPELPQVLPLDSFKDDALYDEDTGGLIGHGSGSWRCAFCPTKPPFRYRRSYEKHLMKHFSNMSGNIASAVENVMNNAESNKESSAPENCPICEEEFKERSKLRHHLQTVHETDIVEVSDDNLDHDDSADPWGEEGINQHKFSVQGVEDMDQSDNHPDDEDHNSEVDDDIADTHNTFNNGLIVESYDDFQQ